MVFALNGDLAQAEKVFRQALEDSLGYTQGYLNLGLVLAQQQRFAEAKAPLDKALQLAPEDLRMLSAAGKVKARLGKSEEGNAQLRKVAVLSPESAAAHFNHGRVLFDLERSAEARPNLEVASRLAPHKERRIIDRAETLANDAVASMQAQDWPEAIPHLKQAIAACGECSVRAERHKKLGLMHCHAGHLDSGEKELRLAQAAKPDDPEVERALALIAQARKPATEARSKTGAR
jgi:tetratricopeptide (TPR) repeat protein